MFLIRRIPIKTTFTLLLLIFNICLRDGVQRLSYFNFQPQSLDFFLKFILVIKTTSTFFLSFRNKVCFLFLLFQSSSTLNFRYTSLNPFPRSFIPVPNSFPESNIDDFSLPIEYYRSYLTFPAVKLHFFLPLSLERFRFIKFFLILKRFLQYYPPGAYF